MNRILRRLGALAVLLCLASTPAAAQFGAGPVLGGAVTSLPATCTPGAGQYLVFLTTGSVGLYECAASNTWRRVYATGDALTSDTLAQFAATTSSQLAGVLTNETGTGAAVFGTAPALTGPITLAEAVGSSGLTITGATQVASFPALNVSQTWNNAGVTFTGLKFNVTDTASAVSSLLLDVQVGGASAIAFERRRQIVITGVNSANNKLRIGNPSSADSGAISYASNNLGEHYSFVGDTTGSGGPAQLKFGAGATITWQSTNRSDSGSVDLALQRDAAGTLAQRNGTNAQTFRLYNTYTDASNYERGFFRYTSNVFEFGHEAAGTGTTSRTARWLYSGAAASSGVAFSVGATDNTIEIAQSAASLPTNGWVRMFGSGAVTATSGTAYGLNLGGTWQPSSTSTMVAVPVRIAPLINYSNATPGAGSYEALKIAVTETALPTGTNYLIRASAGSGGTTDMFRVRNDGRVFVQSGISIYHVGAQGWFGGAGEFGILDNLFKIGSTDDLKLARDAAGILAQRNSTNAQSLRIYNTYTDASNYERFGIAWSANVMLLQTNAAGTGTVRGMTVQQAAGALGFYGATPVSKPTAASVTAGFTAGAGTAAKSDSTYTGNVGATAYTIGDLVAAMKNLGLITQ